jgi:hypothetical protein
LVDDYKLSVVVDGSPNSLDETLLRTKRQSIIIKPMSREMIWKLILSDTLTVKKLQRPTPDKVFREVKQDGVFVLIAASNAIGIVLKHSLKKEPTLNELEELLKIKV